MNPDKRKLIDAIIAHAEGERAKHVAQLDAILNTPVMVSGHAALFDMVEDELEAIAIYSEQIRTLTEIYA